MGSLNKGEQIMTTDTKIVDKILQHEDMWKAPFFEFLAYHFRANGNGVPRTLLDSGDYARKHIKARVDDGRWIVDCPNCNSAMLTSSKMSVFVCAECGSPETEGRFYEIRRPKAREEIERRLLLRPANKGRTPGLGGPRFYAEDDVTYEVEGTIYRLIAGQTVDELRAENEELGCGV